MEKLGKGIAFFLVFCGVSIFNNNVNAGDIRSLNWLPLFSASMDKFQPDTHCPQNQINGLRVNKTETKIHSSVHEISWDIDCTSQQVENKTTLPRKTANDQIPFLLNHLVKLPEFNLDFNAINLTTHFLKTAFQLKSSIGKNTSQFIVKLESDLINAHLLLELQSKKLSLDAQVELEKLSNYVELPKLYKSFGHGLLSLQYKSDLNSWPKGTFKVDWQGTINGFSEHADLFASGDINLLTEQLIFTDFVINANQVTRVLSEKQSWKTEAIKIAITDPASINFASQKIQKLPLQLRIASSYLLTKVERGKSKRIRVDKQSIPPLFLQFKTFGDKHDLLVDWNLALLNQKLQGRLLMDSNTIKVQLPENDIELKPLMTSLGRYIDDLQLVEVEKGTLKFSLLAEYNRGNNTLIFESSASSNEIAGKNGDLLFNGAYVNSHLHYRVDESQNITVIKDRQSLKVANLFVGIPIQTLQIDAQIQAGTPIIQHFKSRLLGGRVDFDDLKLTAPSQTNLNISGISLAEIIKYSAYPEIQSKAIIDGVLPLVLTAKGPEINKGVVFARSPGGYIKVPENTVIKAMGSSNPAISFTLQLLSDFHFNTLQGTIGYTSDGESDLKVKIEGKNSEVSGIQPVHFNYSHNENILKLLKTLRFSDELERDLKEKY